MTPKEFRCANLTLTLPNGASATHSSPSLLASERRLGDGGADRVPGVGAAAGLAANGSYFLCASCIVPIHSFCPFSICSGVRSALCVASDHL
jgi:hypothetical protein